MKAGNHKHLSFSDRAELSRQLKEAFDTVSPFIEKHTAVVCPDCKEVCCADQHGRHDDDDLLFLEALGEEVPEFPVEKKEDGACRFMAETGCSLERWMRPYRCTLFFCDSLMKSLACDNAKLYRAFLDYFEHLVLLRKEMFG
jgi:hypothetical protein